MNLGSKKYSISFCKNLLCFGLLVLDKRQCMHIRGITMCLIQFHISSQQILVIVMLHSCIKTSSHPKKIFFKLRFCISIYHTLCLTNHLSRIMQMMNETKVSFHNSSCNKTACPNYLPQYLN